ncbi:response regulator [Salmonella enterica]|nr:response regulator [Salmonella enterica]
MDSITTLIVEDEPMLAEILVDTIKLFPQFSIVGIADKLESAKKQIRLYQPQLILLDNFLPDGKGIDLIRHTISTNYTGRIIFITADNHMDTISDALFNIQAKEQTAEPNSGLRGIDENTFNRVRQIFADPQAVHTADTLAQILGSSKTTARRYLEQGVKNNFLEAEISYGKVGRPERLYRGKV